MVKEVTPQQLKHYIDSGKKVVVLDVRESEELLISSFPNSTNIPLMLIPDEIETWKSKCLDADIRVVICRVGARSAQAVEYLNYALGVEHLNLSGGINRYAQEIDSTIPVY